MNKILQEVYRTKTFKGVAWVFGILAIAVYAILISPSIVSEPTSVPNAAKTASAGRLLSTLPYLESEASKGNPEANFILGTLNFGAFVKIDGLSEFLEGESGSGINYNFDDRAYSFDVPDRSSLINRFGALDFIPRGEFLVKMSREKGVTYLESAYRLGHAGAATVLGKAYEKGMPGAPKDEKIAREYTEFAVAKGDLEASYNLGSSLLIEAESCRKFSIPDTSCRARLNEKFARASSLLEKAAQSPDSTVRGASIDELMQMYSGEKGSSVNREKLAYWASILNKDNDARGYRASRLQTEGLAAQSIDQRDRRTNWEQKEMQKYDDFCARNRSLKECW